MAVCPKCGAAVAAGAVICPACDFVVDTSFLEDYTGEHAGSAVDDFNEKTGAFAEKTGAFAEKTGGFASAPGTTPGISEADRTGRAGSFEDNVEVVELAPYVDEGATELGPGRAAPRPASIDDVFSDDELALISADDDVAAIDDDAPDPFADARLTDEIGARGGALEVLVGDRSVDEADAARESADAKETARPAPEPAEYSFGPAPRTDNDDSDGDDIFSGEGAFIEDDAPPAQSATPAPVEAESDDDVFGASGDSDDEGADEDALFDDGGASGGDEEEPAAAPASVAAQPAADADEDVFGDDDGGDGGDGDGGDDGDEILIVDDDMSGEVDLSAGVDAGGDEAGGAYGGEALILGDFSGGDFDSMLSDATSSFAIADGVPRVLEPAPVYIAQNVQRMVEPAAVLALKPGASPASLALSKLEQRVIALVDGERPVARIAKKAGVSATDVKIAIGMLADRKLLVVKGHLKPDALSMLDAGDLDETGEVTLPPPTPVPVQAAPKPFVPAMPGARAVPLPAPAPVPTKPVAVTASVTDEDPANGADHHDDSLLDDEVNDDSGGSMYDIDRVAMPVAQPPPMELPLDALTPLDLPLDALTPLPPPARFPEPSPFQSAGAAEEETAFPGMAVRPALNVRPATTATKSKAAAAASDPVPRVNSGAAPAARPPAMTTTAAAPPPAAAAKGPPMPMKAQAPVDAATKIKAQQALDLALKDLREGKKARAHAYVKMAAELDPTDLKARQLLDNWGKAEQIAKSESEDQRLVADAQRCEEMGQFENAVNIYRKVIAMKPAEPELHNRLGILLALRQKDFSGAINALMKATELAPDNLAYRSNLGKVFKLSEGKADKVKLHAGHESDALKDELKAGQKGGGFLDRLRGKK